ncbi:MAG: UDP-N-acetylmuramate dehydrogenase [Planctomycetota bacterium]
MTQRPASVLVNQPLSERTSFRIGGRARWFTEPESQEQLEEALAWAAAAGLPLFVLGGGTNTLIPDEGFSGLVVSMGSYVGIERLDAVDDDLRHVSTLPGTPLRRVIHETMKWGLAGLERFVGIPGTIGGAVYGNAGGRGAEIGDFVKSVTVYDAGQLSTLSGSEIEWRYRSSGLGSRIILEVTLGLPQGERRQVTEVAKELFNKKRASQPLRAASAGCVFRNPPGEHAGALIERAGLKGESVGGARVSDQHANFIVNDGGATADDVAQLIARIQERVRQMFGVELQHEIVVPSAAVSSNSESQTKWVGGKDATQ